MLLPLDPRRSRRRHPLVERNIPINEMALQLGRHRSTIYREIKRNTFRDRALPDYDGYYGTVANVIAKERRRRLRKLRRHPHLCRMVLEKLEAYWSPEQIAGRLLADGISLVRIGKETIYRFIYGTEDYGLGLYAICPRHAANAVRVARGSHATACFRPITGYRNGAILLAIDRCLDTGKTIS